MSDSNSSSLLHDRYPHPVDLYGRFTPNFLLFDRLVTPIWYVLGLFGNILSAIVWLSPEVRRNNSSAVYLAALSIWDLVFLLLHTYQELKEAWNIFAESILTCSLLPVVLLTAQYLSPLLVLGFTIERWVSVCFPFQRESLCTPRRAGAVVSVMTAGVFLWNLWQLHFKVGCDVRGDGWGWPVYTLATEILISGLVPASALVFNLLVVREIRRIASAGAARKRGSAGGDGTGGGFATSGGSDSGNGGCSERRFRTTTVTLLSVSFFVILTSLPAGLIYGLQTMAKFGSVNMTDAQVLSDPAWQRHFAMVGAKKVIDEISLAHYSLNFFIYLATGPQYRRRVKDLFSRLWHTVSCQRHWLTGGRRRSDSWSGAAATVEERRLSSVSVRRSRRAAVAAAAAAAEAAAGGQLAAVADGKSSLVACTNAESRETEGDIHVNSSPLLTATASV